MKIKALLYTAKAKPILRKFYNYCLDKHTDNYYWKKGQVAPYNFNGKIVAKCDYEVEEIDLARKWNSTEDFDLVYETSTLNEYELLERSCLYINQLDDYLYGKNGKAIHIKNLHIFDVPKELSECHKIITIDDADFNENDYKYVPITKAPQNMMRVWLYENGDWVMYILISIQSQWMCKILNREKDVEVRKVVLKEMLK